MLPCSDHVRDDDDTDETGTTEPAAGGAKSPEPESEAARCCEEWRAALILAGCRTLTMQEFRGVPLGKAIDTAFRQGIEIRVRLKGR